MIYSFLKTQFGEFYHITFQGGWWPLKCFYKFSESMGQVTTLSRNKLLSI